MKGVSGASSIKRGHDTGRQVAAHMPTDPPDRPVLQREG